MEKSSRRRDDSFSSPVDLVGSVRSSRCVSYAVAAALDTAAVWTQLDRVAVDRDVVVYARRRTSDDVLDRPRPSTRSRESPTGGGTGGCCRSRNDQVDDLIDGRNLNLIACSSSGDTCFTEWIDAVYPIDVVGENDFMEGEVDDDEEGKVSEVICHDAFASRSRLISRPNHFSSQQQLEVLR